MNAETTNNHVDGRSTAVTSPRPAAAGDRPVPVKSSMAGDPGMSDVLREFVAGLADEVRRLEDCGRRGDAVGQRRVVHQLRGACGGYGFDSIGSRAAEVEDSFVAPADPRAIARGVGGLIDLIRRVDGFGTTGR